MSSLSLPQRLCRPSLKLLLAVLDSGESDPITGIVNDRAFSEINVIKASQISRVEAELIAETIDAIVLDLDLFFSLETAMAWIKTYSQQYPIILWLQNGEPETIIPLLDTGIQDCWIKGNCDRATQQRSLLLAIHRHQHQQEISGQREFLAQVMNAIPDPIFVQNEDDRLLWVNEAYGQLFQTSPTQLLGKRDRDMIPSIEKTDEQAAETGPAPLSAQSFTDSTGKQHLFTTQKTPLITHEGEKLLVGIRRDITPNLSPTPTSPSVEQTLQKLTDNVPGMIYRLQMQPTGEQRCLFASSGCKEIYEQAPEQLQQDLSIIWEQQIHPEDLESFNQSVAQAAELMQPWRWEWRSITPSGQLKWLKGAARPEQCADGTLQWDGVVMDISELKKAQLDRDRFFTIALDLLCIAGFDGTFKRINPLWQEILGYSEAELLGRPFIEFVHPDDQAATLAEAAKLSQGHLVIRFENRYRCQDGSYRWLSWTSAPDTEQGLIYATARDITEAKRDEVVRKTAEEVLQQTESTNRALLDAIPDMMFRSSREGIYLDYKPAKNQKAYVPPSVFLGRNVLEVLPSDLANRIIQAQHQALATGEVVQLEYQMEMDGQMQDYEARIVACEGRQEVIAIIRDISPQKALLRERQQAEAKLAERARHSALKSEIGLALTQEGSLEETLQRCCAILNDSLEMAFVRIWTFNAAENVLELQASAGMYTHIDGDHARVPVGQFKIGLIASERQPHLTNDVVNDPRVGNRDWAKREGMVAFAGYPLIVEDRLVGVLGMFAKHILSPQILEVLETVAHHIAIGIERKLVLESLQVSQERLQLALEGSGLGIWDWNIQTGAAYLDLRWKGILGYSESEIANHIDSFQQLMHPEDLPRVLEVLRVYLGGGADQYRVEFRMRMKSGAWKWILAQGKIFEWDAEGRPVRMAGTHLDLTERKHIEDELRLFRQAVESASDAVGVADVQGRHFYQNMAFTRLYEYDTPQDFVDAGSIAAAFADAQSCQEVCDRIFVGESWVGEVEQMSRTGRRFPALLRADAIKDDRGQVVGYMAVSSDISDRKAAEMREQQRTQELETTLRELRTTQSQLVQQEKMASLGQLVAGVAHEINNPVNFIYGNIQYAQDYSQDLLELVSLYQHHYPEPNPTIQERLEELDVAFLRKDFLKLLESMKTGATRIKEIVLSLRTFSRLDEAEMKAADLHAGIDSTLMILQHRLKEHSPRPAIEIIRHYADLPMVECYPGQLNQVFMNLLSNGIDAVEERFSQDPDLIPTLWIETHLKPASWESPACVVIRIRDNGKGMAPEVQAHLFEPFFTTKPVGRGTGLGLSISYQIVVDKHQGQINCRSILGQGSEFILEIPLKAMGPSSGKTSA